MKQSRSRRRLAAWQPLVALNGEPASGNTRSASLYVKKKPIQNFLRLQQRKRRSVKIAHAMFSVPKAYLFI